MEQNALGKIKRRIKRLDCKKNRVIKKAGISQSLFYKVMNGSRKLTPETQARLFFALNIKQ